MIKYYCDICGKEITESRVKAEIRCNVIPDRHTVDLYLHKACAVDFIGADRLAKMQAEYEERKKANEVRKEARKKATDNA